MQVERQPIQPPKTVQPGFGICPKAFNSVDMTWSSFKFIHTMLHPEVFFVVQIDQTVVSSPPIGMNDAFETDSSTNNHLKGGIFTVGDNLREHLTVSSEDTEDDGFSKCSAPRRPLILLASKYVSGSFWHCSATLTRIALRYLLTVFLLRPATEATWEAFRSTAKSLTSSRNLASEIFVFFLRTC